MTNNTRHFQGVVDEEADKTSLDSTSGDQDPESDSGVVTRNTSVGSNFADKPETTDSDSKSTLVSFKCAYSDSKIPKIDTSNAYILFYERSGLNYKPYLPEVVANGQIVSADLEHEDDENDLRKQPCSIQ